MKVLSHEKSSRKLQSSVKLFLKTMKRYSVVEKKSGKARLKCGIFNVCLKIYTTLKTRDKKRRAAFDVFGSADISYLVEYVLFTSNYYHYICQHFYEDIYYYYYYYYYILKFSWMSSKDSQNAPITNSQKN
jgi:hypothetical protein